MQLSQDRNAGTRTERRQQLRGAMLALLGGAAASPALAAGSEADPALQYDTGWLYYQENAGRIGVGEAVVNVKRAQADGTGWSGRITVDAISGGTPNGAIASRTLQTFSTPSGSTLTPAGASPGGGAQTCTTPSGITVACGSGGGTSSVYVIQPGDTPIDKSFKDQRFAGSFTEVMGVGRYGKVSLGGALSAEHDFDSASLNALGSWDLFQRNTTVSGGVNLEFDQVRPIGGAPVPWSAYELFHKNGTKTKHADELVLGVTQVVNRYWITQLNLGEQREAGYLTDPYKILSVVDASGNLNGYVYEARPGNRNRFSLYWDNKLAIGQDVLALSVRHTNDTWKVKSDTLDLRYRWSLGAGGYFEPHLRAYRQSAASFYDLFLFNGPVTNGYASADPRLGGFKGRTFGLKYGMPSGENQEWSLRIEHYTQTPDAPGPLPTQLQGLTLNPGMQAWILQAGFRFEF